jgi:hypothetical protein
MAIGLAVVLTLALADAARAGTYEVIQCGWGVGSDLDRGPEVYGAGFTVGPGHCAPGVEPQGLRFEAAGSDTSGGWARARWIAPPETAFVAVSGSWAGSMQPGFERLLGFDVGPEFRALVSGGGVGVFVPVASPIPGGAWAVEARLTCHGICARSIPSWLVLSGLTLGVYDPVPPKAAIGGTLLAPGWQRGVGVLEIAATDDGGGVAREEASADGTPLAGAPEACAVTTLEGAQRGTRLQPCPPIAHGTLEVDTRKLADGVHALRGCAVDFGGEVGCAADARIEVDNSPPAIAFAATQAGQVAVALSDPYSGPAAGTISVQREGAPGPTELPTRFEAGAPGTARLVADLPQLGDGTYVFRATGSDALGNAGSTELRVKGSAAEVREQVAAAGGSGKEGAPKPRGGRGHGGDADQGRRVTHIEARLAAGGGHGPGRVSYAATGRGTRGRGDRRSSGSTLTIPFGTGVAVRGRLTGGDGSGLPREPVEVVASAARGATPGRALRRVLTGPGGHFALRLPAGPSRRVLVAFRGGDGLASSRSRPLALRVAAAVDLTATPHELATGESVLLRGRVRRGPARIPRRGKVVTIQYLERASGDWRPALVARTDGRGRFGVRYRFRYITGAARIRLRATALPEAGWPYAAGSSAPVTVEVHGE